MELWLYKEDDATRKERDLSPDDDSATRDDERHPLVCRSCGNEISDKEAIFGVDGDSPYRVFSNPYGLLREIVTLQWARGLHLAGPPTTEFTWFPGYAWEIAYCDSCSVHLGWHFTATETDAATGEFFGLLRSELVDADSPL